MQIIAIGTFAVRPATGLCAACAAMGIGAASFGTASIDPAHEAETDERRRDLMSASRLAVSVLIALCAGGAGKDWAQVAGRGIAASQTASAVSSERSVVGPREARKHPRPRCRWWRSRR
jgi:hypothetical protein